MMIDSIIFSIFGLSTILGQIGALEVSPGVRIYLHDILLLFMFLFYAVRQKNLRLIPGYVLPFTGFAVLSLLFALFRMPPAQVLTGSLYLLRWILYSGIAGCIAASSLSPFALLSGTYLVALALAGFGIIQMVWYPDLRNMMYLGWDPHYRRLFSTLLDPNFTGLILSLGFMTGLGILSTRKKNHLPILMAQGMMFIAIYLTHSRSAYAAFAVACLVWGIRMKRFVRTVAVILVCAFSVIYLSGPNEWDNIFRTASANARIENSIAAVRLFGRSPVFGYGFNTLRYVQCGGGTCADRYGNASHAAAGVDNSLMFLLLTTGVVGASGFVWMIYAIAMSTGGISARFAWIVDGFVAGCAAIFVHSVFINSLFYPWTLIYLWTYVGVVRKVRGYTSRSVSPR